MIICDRFNKPIELYNSDILDWQCPSQSIDLILTSPPYNVKVEYDGYTDNLEMNDYWQWTNDWLARMYAGAKKDGRLIVNIPLTTYKDGSPAFYTSFSSVAANVGWKFHDVILWHKNTVSSRTAWGSWKSASAPSVIPHIEIISVFYKEEWKKTGGTRVSDISRDEFIEWTNGLWTMTGQQRATVGNHPAPFPLELPTRCIKLFSFVGDTVLDPFVGSGTTLVACANTGRHGIGVEKSCEYFQFTKKRVRAILL